MNLLAIILARKGIGPRKVAGAYYVSEKGWMRGRTRGVWCGGGGVWGGGGVVWGWGVFWGGGGERGVPGFIE